MTSWTADADGIGARLAIQREASAKSLERCRQEGLVRRRVGQSNHRYAMGE